MCSAVNDNVSAQDATLLKPRCEVLRHGGFRLCSDDVLVLKDHSILTVIK